MENKDFEIKIEQTMAAYKKVVNDFSKLRELYEILSSEREWLVVNAKRSKTDISKNLSEIDKKLKGLKDREEAIGRKLSLDKFDCFYVTYTDLMQVVKKHLLEMYDKKDIEVVLDVVSSDMHTIEDFYYTRDYWHQKYEIGYIANGKKFLLPTAKNGYDELSKIDAYEAFFCGNVRSCGLFDLLAGSDENFASEDWKEIFWGLVRAKLTKNIDDIIKSREDAVEKTKKYYDERLGNAFITEENIATEYESEKV